MSPAFAAPDNATGSSVAETMVFVSIVSFSSPTGLTGRRYGQGGDVAGDFLTFTGLITCPGCDIGVTESGPSREKTLGDSWEGVLPA